MKAVITGGTGFIGSWLIQELLRNDYKVCAIVRKSEKLLPEFLINPDFCFIEKEICDINVEELKNFFKSDVLFHVAWDGVKSENKNDLKRQMKNIQLAIDVMNLAKKIECNKLVATGTVAEYVFSQEVLNVNEKQTPNDYYGAAKVSTHYFLDVHSRQIDQPYIWAVIPSTFGERRDDNNIITYTIRTLLKGEIPVYGKLTQMWDFLYVSEVVRALRLVAEKGTTGVTYGIGSGLYRPLRDYICEIRDMIDPSLSLNIGANREMSEKTLNSCVNNYRLIADTGFSAQISFRDGIARTIEYLRNSEKGG